MSTFDEQTPKNEMPVDEPCREAPQAQGLADIEAFAAATPTGATKAARAKKPRRLAVLLSAVALVAVLAVAVWAIPALLPPEEPEEEDLPDTSVVLLDKELDKDGKKPEHPIKEVHITSLLGDYTLLLNENNVWQLQGEDDLALNTSAVESLVDTLLYISAEDTVATKREDVSAYGLDSPTVTVHVTYADDVTVKLALAKLPVGNGHYLRMDDGDTVYLLDNTLADEVMKKPEAFVSLQAIAAPSVKEDDAVGTVVLKELSLTGAVRDNVITTIRIKNAEDGAAFENANFLITAPYLVAADSGVATTVFSTTEVFAEEVVALHPTAAQLAEYGLETPSSVAKIQLAVSTGTTDEEGNVTEVEYYNVMNHLLKLGKKTSDGAAYYAMADTMDVIFLVSADYVPWAELTYHDMASQYLFLRNLPTLSSISCTVYGEEYQFLFTHHPEAETLDEKLTVTLNGKVLRTHEFRVLYQVLMTLYRTGAAPAEPQGTPMLTVKVTSTDESLPILVTDIYEHSGSTCIARTETGDTYKMTASRVLDAIQQIKNYINGDDVVNRF